MDKGRSRKIGGHLDWADWLSDNPPSETARQELRRRKIAEANNYRPRGVANPEPQVEQSKKPADVVININLTKFRLPKFKVRKFQLRPRLYAKHKRAIVALAVAVVVVLTGVAVWGHGGNTSAGYGQPSGVASGPVRSNPSFTPVAPSDKPKLGQFQPKNTAYDGRRNLYSYTDNLQNNRLTVSEQPLPDKYGSDQKAISKIASQIGADQPIALQGGRTAYVKTDSRSNAQTIVLNVGKVLVIVNSPYAHTNQVWAIYLNSLR
ncbi:MAG TPA: hypothetical protein VFW90_03675 [Candidatus Saccharimonadales bacterium]|nr:hypothetical protein [Candidatus Saccharimonadales bacterium]